MIVAVAFVLASVSLTLLVWRSVGGTTPLQPKRFEVKARFDNAGQLTRNADVRISGVNVGKVVTVRPRGLRTEATLAIDARYVPLPRDVRAILRQKTLLGETFVAMTPGSRDGPKLREGDDARGLAGRADPAARPGARDARPPDAPPHARAAHERRDDVRGPRRRRERRARELGRRLARARGDHADPRRPAPGRRAARPRRRHRAADRGRRADRPRPPRPQRAPRARGDRRARRAP